MLVVLRILAAQLGSEAHEVSRPWGAAPRLICRPKKLPVPLHLVEVHLRYFILYLLQLLGISGTVMLVIILRPPG